MAELAIIALCVQTVFLFFMVESFHRISPLAPLLNVPAGLIAPLVIPLTLLTIFLPEPVAKLAAWTVAKLLHAMSAILDFALRLPGATLRVPSPPVWIWGVYGIALVALIWAVRSRRFGVLLAAGIAVLGLQTSVALADFSEMPPRQPTMTVLDVGQGDSILLEFPAGQRILVDGGGVSAGRFLGLRDESGFSIGESVVSPYLWSKGIRKLDALVLTHAHNDHIDGLLDVIENFEVGELWLGRNPMSPVYQELLRRAMEKQVRLRWLTAGMHIPIANGSQAFPEFSVLHPPAQWQPRKNDQNNDSLVLLLDTGKITALLTGDIVRKIPAPERVDVYKIPHHGSKGVKLQVSAPIRIISVGANNPFGHPDPSTLPALRTDLLGAITVTLAQPPRIGSALTQPSRWYKLATLLESH